MPSPQSSISAGPRVAEHLSFEEGERLDPEGTGSPEPNNASSSGSLFKSMNDAGSSMTITRELEFEDSMSCYKKHNSVIDRDNRRQEDSHSIDNTLSGKQNNGRSSPSTDGAGGAPNVKSTARDKGTAASRSIDGQVAGMTDNIEDSEMTDAIGDHVWPQDASHHKIGADNSDVLLSIGKRPSSSSSTSSPKDTKIRRLENGRFTVETSDADDDDGGDTDGDDGDLKKFESSKQSAGASERAQSMRDTDGSRTNNDTATQKGSTSASETTADIMNNAGNTDSSLPRKKNLDERTLKAVENYLRSGDFLRSETLEYEDITAYELKIHKYATERMRARQIMVFPEEVNETAHNKNLSGSAMFPEEEWMYNQIYQEEEFFSLSNGFAKSVANEAADREPSSFTLHNKTFNWVKRAAGISRPYDPYSQRRPNTTMTSRSGGGDDDSDEETDEGGESDSGPSGGRRLTRRRARMTRKKRRQERIEKETEGLRILAEVVKEMKIERAKQLAQERERRKKHKQGRNDYGIDSSDDDFFCDTRSNVGRRPRKIFGPLELDNNSNAHPDAKQSEDLLSLSMLEWNIEMNESEILTTETVSRPKSITDSVSRFGLEYIPQPLKVHKASCAESDLQLRWRQVVARRGRAHNDDKNMTNSNPYKPIAVGTDVIALHPKLQTGTTGKVLLHDSKNHEYLIQFKDRALGWHVCSEVDVAEDSNLVLLHANDVYKEPGFADQREVDREVLLTLLVLIKDAFDQKLLILQAIELITADRSIHASSIAKQQLDWLLDNLKHVNSTMDAVLKRFQMLYGKIYADPDSALKLLDDLPDKKALPKHNVQDSSKSFLDWSGDLSLTSNTVVVSVVGCDIVYDGSLGLGISDNKNVTKSDVRVQHALNSTIHLLLLANYLDQTVREQESFMSSSKTPNEAKSKAALDAAFQYALNNAVQINLPAKSETDLMDGRSLMQDSQLESAFGELGEAVGMLRAELSVR